MAVVTISQHWPDDGGCTTVQVTFEDSYPEAMARAVDETIRGWLVATGADSDEDVT